MELPGFRERICHIRLSKSEGGLNLNMSADTIKALQDRGEEAGLAILAEFSWSQQIWERFRLLSALLQRSLQTAGKPENWGAYQQLLGRADFSKFEYAEGLHEMWRKDADGQMSKLLEAAAAWGQAETVSFEAGELPTPFPAMRITPDV
jgi:hypothetical protein